MHSIRANGRCTCNRPACHSPGKHPIKSLSPQKDKRWGEGFKHATTDPATIRTWWERCPYANVGIVLGREYDGKCLAAADLDVDDQTNGIDVASEVYGYDPKAAGPCARTGGGGMHGLMLVPADLALKSRTGDASPVDGVEIKVNGYIVAPPSIHTSGRVYEWAVHPDDEPLPDAPAWFIEAARIGDGDDDDGKAAQRPRGELPDRIRHRTRNTTLFHHGCALRRIGHTLEEVEALLQEVNVGRCDPPLDRGEVATIAESCARYEPVVNIGDLRIGQFHQNDDDNARLICRLFGDHLRYDHTRGRWMVFEAGLWWAPDVLEFRARLAAKAAEIRAKLAYKQLDDADAKDQFKHAVKSRDRYRVKAALEAAASQEPVRDDGRGWNDDPWLLGTMTGVVDLRTGKQRPGQPEDRISLHTPYGYDPEATCPLWEAALLDICSGSQELVDLLWRLFGYSLTGLVREHVMVLLVGAGRNGKTVILNVAKRVFGGLAVELPTTALASKGERHGGERASPDVAIMRDARMAICRESKRGLAWDEERVKRLTGGDPLQGRDVYERYDREGWRNTAVLWLACNHLPNTQDDSPAFWDRILVVPFERRYRKTEDLRIRLQAQGCADGTVEDALLENEGVADLALEDTLIDQEAEGILAWCVRGAVEYHRMGLAPPEAVRHAVASYHGAQDPVARFLQECCVEGRMHAAYSGELFAAFNSWAATADIPEALCPKDSRVFGRRLAAVYGKGEHTRKGTLYHGVALSGGLFDDLEGGEDEPHV